MEIRVLFFIIMLIALWFLFSDKGRAYIQKTAQLIVEKTKLEV